MAPVLKKRGIWEKNRGFVESDLGLHCISTTE